MELHSNVQLGVPDEVIASLDDLNNEWHTNKFGGTPNWMQDSFNEHPRCSLCNASLPLVNQIYCPLENSCFHRVVYIFGCTNISCWNKKESWKVLRCQLRVEDSQEAKAPKIQEKDSWCDHADEWGEEDNEASEIDSSSLEQLEQRTKALNLSEATTTTKGPSNDVDNGRTCSKQVAASVKFLPYYITVVEESKLSFEENALAAHGKKMWAEYRKREGLRDVDEMMEAQSAQGWGSEKYEQSVAKHGDKLFQKFQKQLSLCPKQCLRYSWNGKPLLMSSQTLGEIPSCPFCRQKRVFEIQLMPALVLLLQPIQKSCPPNLSVEKILVAGDEREIIDDDDSVEKHRDECMQSHAEQCREEAIASSQNIEFGTVFVYTCSQNCWSDDVKFREEYATVQSDPDQHFFKF